MKKTFDPFVIRQTTVKNMICLPSIMTGMDMDIGRASLVDYNWANKAMASIATDSSFGCKQGKGSLTVRIVRDVLEKLKRPEFV